MIRGDTRGEAYSLLVYENKKRLFYANTSGRVGYVDKHKIDPLTKEVKDDYIVWLKPFVKVSYGASYLFIRLGKHRRLLKKVMAKAFIRGYDQQTHTIANIDGNFKNCALSNLVIIERANGLCTKKAQVIKVISPNGATSVYKGLINCSKSLCVDEKTLWNHLHQKFINGVLSDYRFYVNDKPVIPKQKKTV